MEREMKTKYELEARLRKKYEMKTKIAIAYEEDKRRLGDKADRICLDYINGQIWGLEFALNIENAGRQTKPASVED